jgi:transcriptional regulator with GAF, ATPase, and Fis domain
VSERGKIFGIPGGGAIGANKMAVNRRFEVLLEVAELMRHLQQQQVRDIDTALRELTESAVTSLPGADHAAITVACRNGKLRTVAATGRYPALLDEIQQRHAEGPCLSDAWQQHVIRISNLTLEQRWPAYCHDAVHQTPIRSIVAFQFFADHHTMGALSFYAEQPDAFDDESVELGLILATHMALAWNMFRRDEQFRSALASRDVIGQAKGMIMERFDVDAVQAFELLKRLSQSSNTPVAEIAHRLVVSRSR